MKLLEHLRLAQSCPVDGERHLIGGFTQVAGGITGEPQDSRPADTPVGDEQRSLGTHLRSGYSYMNTLDHRTHQVAESLVGNAQREERRYGRHDLMASVGQPLKAFRTG